MNNIEKKVKVLLKNGEKRKDIAQKLDISLYKLDKIKKRLIDNGEIEGKDKKEKIPDRELEAYKTVIDVMSRRYLDYGTTQSYCTPLSKKMKELHKKYDYVLILKTINYCNDSLLYASKKQFENIYHKVSYLCAIIRNNIEKVRKSEQKKIRNRIENEKIVDVKEVQKQRVSIPTTKRDLSEFLDD